MCISDGDAALILRSSYIASGGQAFPRKFGLLVRVRLEHRSKGAKSGCVKMQKRSRDLHKKGQGYGAVEEKRSVSLCRGNAWTISDVPTVRS